MAQQAQDTFVAELESGPMMVAKGQVFPDEHPVVQLDGGRGLLFRALDLGDGVKPAGKAAKAAG